MEHGYVKLDTVIKLANMAWGTDLKLIPQKRIMYRSIGKDGRTMTLLTPKAGLQPKGFFWADITEIQYDEMNKTECAAVIFRLDYHTLALVKWEELKKYMTPDSMYHTEQEGNHWKLHIDGKTIKVCGNKTEMPVQIMRVTGEIQEDFAESLNEK